MKTIIRKIWNYLKLFLIYTFVIWKVALLLLTCACIYGCIATQEAVPLIFKPFVFLFFLCLLICIIAGSLYLFYVTVLFLHNALYYSATQLLEHIGWWILYLPLECISTLLATLGNCILSELWKMFLYAACIIFPMVLLISIKHALARRNRLWDESITTTSHNHNSGNNHSSSSNNHSSSSLSTSGAEVPLQTPENDTNHEAFGMIQPILQAESGVTSYDNAVTLPHVSIDHPDDTIYGESLSILHSVSQTYSADVSSLDSLEYELNNTLAMCSNSSSSVDTVIENIRIIEEKKDTLKERNAKRTREWVFDSSELNRHLPELPVLYAVTSTSRSDTFSCLHYQRWLSTDDEKIKTTETRSLSDIKNKNINTDQWLENHRARRRKSTKRSILYKKSQPSEIQQICRQFETYLSGKPKRIWSIISNEGFGIVSKSPLRPTRSGQLGLTLHRWCIPGGVGLDLKDRMIVIYKHHTASQDDTESESDYSLEIRPQRTNVNSSTYWKGTALTFGLSTGVMIAYIGAFAVKYLITGSEQDKIFYSKQYNKD